MPKSVFKNGTFSRSNYLIFNNFTRFPDYTSCVVKKNFLVYSKFKCIGVKDNFPNYV